MTDTNQKTLGNTLRKIADDLRGSMNAGDFRDYTQSGELLNTPQAGFKVIETESFVINFGSDKLGKKYEDRNAKFCTFIQKITEGLSDFSTDIDELGDAYVSCDSFIASVDEHSTGTK